MDPPMMAPLLVVPAPAVVAGALGSVDVSVGALFVPVGIGKPVVEDDVVAVDEDLDEDEEGEESDDDPETEDDDGSGPEGEDPDVDEGSVASEDVTDEVPGTLPDEGFPSGSAVSLGGWDPIEVG